MSRHDLEDQSAADRRYMRRALALARRGLGCASPNPPVGCILVRHSEIVGQGYHDYGGRDHAEVHAVRRAGSRARGATAYITLEPCAHHGRTPPCAEFLVESGIRRVVVPLLDPNPRVSGAGMDLLRSAGILVDVGLMRKEGARLIEPFACHITTGRPLVVCKVGMSLDGRIASRTGVSRWITSPEGRKFGQELRYELDAILVGRGTALADNPDLSYRGSKYKRKPLLRVILDGHLRTPPGANLLENAPDAPVLIFCAQNADKRRQRRLEERGAEIVPVPRDESGLNLRRILRELWKRDVLGLLVEGGGEVHWSFISAGLVDKFFFILAPLVLGGKLSVPSVGGKGYDTIEECTRFKIARMIHAGRDLVLEAYPSYSRSLLSPWLAASNKSSIR